MSFFKKLFGKNKKTESKCDSKSQVESGEGKKQHEESSEEKMILATIEFIKANAEGKDGDAECQFEYGVMFATGKGPSGRGSFTKDINQAIYWLDKSAKQGYVDAICMLGRVYMDNGELEKAIKYYRMAAEKDSVAACENLAMAYGMGDGVAEDKVEAHKWFLKAANLGSAFSQYVVGNNYFNGIGVEENMSEAIGWFCKAAEQGESNAQFEMGQLYEYGGQDMETAYKWYHKAAEQGHEAALAKLEANR